MDNTSTRSVSSAAATASCAAHPVGRKGMLVAAKVLAASGVDLLADPAIVKAAKERFAVETKGKPYVSPLPPEVRPKVN